MLSLLQIPIFFFSTYRHIINGLLTLYIIENILDDISQIIGTITEAVGWGGWAWHIVSTVLPVDWISSGFIDWENDWSSQQQMAYSGHTIHLGVYIDDTILTFKVYSMINCYLHFISLRVYQKGLIFVCR